MPARDHRDHHVDHLTDAELNELVDRTLAEKDRVIAQEHLAGCEECNDRYLTLLATVEVLQHAPSLMPRRSFQLTPEQAKLPEKQPSRFDRLANRLVPGIPAIKAATIAVALLLISVTAFDVLTNQSTTNENGQVISMQDGAQPAVQSERETEIPEPGIAMEPTGEPTFGNAAREVPESAEAGEVSDSDAEDASLSEPVLAESASDSAAESDMAADEAAPEAPVMPAQAMQEAIPEASPSPLATATAIPTATPEPSPTSTPTPAPSESGGGTSVSPWRVAELGLLLLLGWLIVSWVGRSRMNDGSESSSKTDSDSRNE